MPPIALTSSLLASSATSSDAGPSSCSFQRSNRGLVEEVARGAEEREAEDPRQRRRRLLAVRRDLEATAGGRVGDEVQSQRAARHRAGRGHVRAGAILVHNLPGDDAAGGALGVGDDLAEVARRAPLREERAHFGARVAGGRGALFGAEVDELRARAKHSIAECLRGVEEQGDVGVARRLREQARDQVGGRRGLGPAARVRERVGGVVDVAARVLRGEGEDRREGAREREREALGIGADARGHVAGGEGARVGGGDSRGVAVGVEEGEPGRGADGREHRRGYGGEHARAVGHGRGACKDGEGARGWRRARGACGRTRAYRGGARGARGRTRGHRGGRAVPGGGRVGTAGGAPCPRESTSVRRWALRARERTRAYDFGRVAPARERCT